MTDILQDEPWTFDDVQLYVRTLAAEHGLEDQITESLIIRFATLAQMAEKLDVNSLAFQDTEGLLSACGGTSDEFCLACFNGDYPVAPPQLGWKHCLETRAPT